MGDYHKKKLKLDNDISEKILTKNININDNNPTCSKNVFNNESKLNVKIVETSKNDGIEETLICTICQDIMYNCVSIQPCLHSYCAVCLLDWKKSGHCCPTCRGKILKVTKNHLVANIIDKFIDQHPDKMRSVEERKRADEEVDKNTNFLYGHKPNKITITVERTNCRFCNYPGTVFYTGGDMRCNDAHVHERCSCCQIHIPNLPNNGINIPIRCQMCNLFFCSLYIGDCSGCEYGCLFKFRDFLLNPQFNNVHQVPQFITDNFYETNVLRNYLNNQNMMVSDMFIQCLEKLSRGQISLNNNINDKSPLCTSCAKSIVPDIIFEYFLTIPKSRLPREVTSRPDCFFGKYCRTQRYRESHCAKYNHVCAQTRF